MTKSAPRPSEATISAPDITPESRMISMSGPASARTSAKACSETGARSSWRPPWLDTTSPSAPASMERRASSAVNTPLTKSLPGQTERIHSRTSIDKDGSNMKTRRVGRSWEVLVKDEKVSGEEVKPPFRAIRCIRYRFERELRRNLHAIANIAQTLAGNRRIHGHQQGIKTFFLCALQKIERGIAFFPQVELEPTAATSIL